MQTLKTNMKYILLLSLFISTNCLALEGMTNYESFKLATIKAKAPNLYPKPIVKKKSQVVDYKFAPRDFILHDFYYTPKIVMALRTASTINKNNYSAYTEQYNTWNCSNTGFNCPQSRSLSSNGVLPPKESF